MSLPVNEELADALVAMRAFGVLPGHEYKHYRTDTVYVVIAVGLQEDTLEPLVHYRSLEDPCDVIWTRPLQIFCGNVIQDGALLARFVRFES